MRAALLWLALIPLAACPGSGEGFLTVSWQITVDGVASDCTEARADRVLIYGQHYPDEFAKSAPCDDGELTTTQVLPEGFWNIFPQIIDGNGNSLNAESEVISIDGDREMEVLFRIPELPPLPADPATPLPTPTP